MTNPPFRVFGMIGGDSAPIEKIAPAETGALQTYQRQTRTPPRQKQPRAAQPGPHAQRPPRQPGPVPNSHVASLGPLPNSHGAMHGRRRIRGSANTTNVFNW